MTPQERNDLVTEAAKKFFERAHLTAKAALPDDLHKDLDLVFSCSTWGFREILLVIVHARLLNNSYTASTSFYDCEPRALYEGPIRSELAQRAIPHRMSGPLNVAKAAKGINAEWAAQREPKSAALAVVRTVEAIEKMSPAQLETFAMELHRKFLDSAIAAARLNVKVEPTADPVYLFALCMHLIFAATDGGNTPQRIAGQLLHVHLADIGSSSKVTGWMDRASVTSTTSKKPGDIAVERQDGTIAQCYEVTVKGFGAARVAECTDSIFAYNATVESKVTEVIVLCRPEDAHPAAKKVDGSEALLGRYVDRGLVFYFADLVEWLIVQLLAMSQRARMTFFTALQEYVHHPNTSAKVKEQWSAFHSRRDAAAE